MGLSWSKRNRYQHQPLRPLSGPTNTSSPTILPLNPTPTTTQSWPNHSNPPPPPPSYAFAANAPHHSVLSPEQHPYPAMPHPPVLHPTPPPPPPLPPYCNNNYSFSFSNYYSRPMNSFSQYSNYRPIYFPQMNGWGTAGGHFPPPLPSLPPPVPYVDHQSAKKVKNDINVHKDTIRLHVDLQNQDCHLVCFTFDALVDGSITIYYFAKEGPLCSFTPIYPEIEPVKIPFQKGLGQKFCQISGTGVDLGFFSTDELSKSSSGEDVYPLVILAESHGPMILEDGQSNQELVNASRHAQISQAVLEKSSENFLVKVIKQILWIDGARYELREIFGISNSDETSVNNMDLGKECVICMTDAKNTAVLPCRHLCMCSECAKELRLQSNKCPICRQPIEELLEIKVDESN